MQVTRRSGITHGASPKSAASLKDQFLKLKQHEIFEIVKSARPRKNRGESHPTAGRRREAPRGRLNSSTLSIANERL